MSCQLKKVQLQSDAYMVCLQHALSTENFEVMGLLIGDNVNGITVISAVLILRRSDKKKNRVEISCEQLFTASIEAERLSKELNRKMRIVGWYHSHPHITVCPSQIDIGTQTMYQIEDSSFIGLIFSVFSEDQSTKEQEVLLTCFQSHGNKCKEIPLEIICTPDISINCCETMIKLPNILAQEEEDTAKNCKDHPDVLFYIHNNAVKIRALGHITDTITRPLVQLLSERLLSNKNRCNFLQEQIKSLKGRQ